MLDDRPQLRAKIVLLLSLRMIFDDRLVPKRSPVITGMLSKGESSQTEKISTIFVTTSRGREARFDEPFDS